MAVPPSTALGLIRWLGFAALALALSLALALAFALAFAAIRFAWGSRTVSCVPPNVEGRLAVSVFLPYSLHAASLPGLPGLVGLARCCLQPLF